MFTGADRLEADKGYLHGEQQAEDVERGVAREQAVGVAAHDKQCEHMQRNEVDDEHVSAPRRDLCITTQRLITGHCLLLCDK